MTQPRPVTPVTRSAVPKPAAAPVPRVAGTGTGGSQPSAGSINVSPDTVRATVSFGVRAAREKIQIVGDSNSGKGWSILQLANKHHEEGKPTKFYWLDLDDGLSKYLNEDQDFEHLNFQNGGNIYPVFCEDWDHFAAGIKLVLQNVKPGDWIITDTAGRAYDYAQQKIAIRRGINVDDATVQRGLAKKGFGAFDGDTWNLVTRTFEAAIKQLIFKPAVNIAFFSHVTDMQEGREKRTVMTQFDQLGLKPRGAPRIPEFMDTIVFLWSVRKVEKDPETKKRVSARTAHMITMVKDRGKAIGVEEPYGNDLFAQIASIRSRRKQIQSTEKEVIDPDEAQSLISEARNEIAEQGADDDFTATAASLPEAVPAGFDPNNPDLNPENPNDPSSDDA